MTETTIVAARTVVRDVEEHTPHLLRVVTVNATLYSPIHSKSLTRVAVTILQQIVTQRRRTFMEELAFLVGASSALVESTRRLLLHLLAGFLLRFNPSQSPTTSFRFNSRDTDGGFDFFARFGLGSSISSGWY